MVRKRSPPLRPSQVPLAPDTARRRPKQVKLRCLSSLLSRLPQLTGLLPWSSSPVPAVSIFVLSAGRTLGLSVQWRLVGRAAAAGVERSSGEWWILSPGTDPLDSLPALHIVTSSLSSFTISVDCSKSQRRRCQRPRAHSGVESRSVLLGSRRPASAQRTYSKASSGKTCIWRASSGKTNKYSWAILHLIDLMDMYVASLARLELGLVLPTQISRQLNILRMYPKSWIAVLFLDRCVLELYNTNE
jgi:hypothetical protein